jgi:hypothetical protein
LKLQLVKVTPVPIGKMPGPFFLLGDGGLPGPLVVECLLRVFPGRTVREFIKGFISALVTFLTSFGSTALHQTLLEMIRLQMCGGTIISNCPVLCFLENYPCAFYLNIIGTLIAGFFITLQIPILYDTQPGGKNRRALWWSQESFGRLKVVLLLKRRTKNAYRYHTLSR